MKKILSCMTLVCLLIGMVLPFSAFAASEDSSAEEILTECADEIITETEIERDATGYQLKYSNLDSFIDYIKSEHPEIDDFTLAVFIMNYTKQFYNESMDRDMVLETLTFSETTSSSEVVRVSKTSVTPVQSSAEIVSFADWNSPDGYLRISTSSSLQTVNGQKRYVVSASANWIKMPSQMMEDLFVLATTGTLDNTYTDYGSIFESYQCTTHNKYVTRTKEATSTNPYGNGISMEYKGGSPGIRFSLSGVSNLCSGGTAHSVSYFAITSYLRYRIIPPTQNTTCQAQASYAHKSMGIGLDWALSTGGLTPTFTVVGQKSEYCARPIAVQ